MSRDTKKSNLHLEINTSSKIICFTNKKFLTDELIKRILRYHSVLYIVLARNRNGNIKVRKDIKFSQYKESSKRNEIIFRFALFAGKKIYVFIFTV